MREMRLRTVIRATGSAGRTGVTCFLLVPIVGHKIGLIFRSLEPHQARPRLAYLAYLSPSAQRDHRTHAISRHECDATAKEEQKRLIHGPRPTYLTACNGAESICAATQEAGHNGDQGRASGSETTNRGLFNVTVSSPDSALSSIGHSQLMDVSAQFVAFFTLVSPARTFHAARGSAKKKARDRSPAPSSLRWQVFSPVGLAPRLENSGGLLQPRQALQV